MTEPKRKEVGPYDIVHMLESARDVDAVVNDIGLKGKARASVKDALIPFAKGGVPAHMAKGDLSTKRGATKPSVSRVYGRSGTRPVAARSAQRTGALAGIISDRMVR